MRSFSRNLVKKRRQEEESLCSQRVSLSRMSHDNLNEDDLSLLSESQTKLDEIYNQKDRSAFVRSRARRLEEGEQSSSYFYGLEKC